MNNGDDEVETSIGGSHDNFQHGANNEVRTGIGDNRAGNGSRDR